MRACCGQQDACIRIGASADASLARSFFPCPVASLCQSAPCNFLAAADQACMLGKTSRISKCTMRGFEISIRKIQQDIQPPTMHDGGCAAKLARYLKYFLAVLGVCRKNLLFLEPECNNCTANLACARAWSQDASGQKCARGTCTKIVRLSSATC